LTQQERIDKEIEAMSKRIDAAYADDPQSRIDAYFRIAWIIGHCPAEPLVELLVACFPFIRA